MSWDRDSIRQEMIAKLAYLSTKTQEELKNDLVELAVAIYPIARIFSYLTDKDPLTIYATSDLFPDAEWELYPQAEELPDEFDVLYMCANFKQFSDMGASIQLRDIKFLEDTLGAMLKKEKS